MPQKNPKEVDSEKRVMCREQSRTKSRPENAPLVERAATASDLVDAAAATREVTRRNAMVTIRIKLRNFRSILWLWRRHFLHLANRIE